VSDAPALVYLEADDEITTAIRRVRASEATRVVVVAPGRSRATSSVVALRLLARSAEEAGRQVAVVGDPLTRSLAAEAGLTAYASVDDARRAVPAADAPSGEAPPAPRHATIRVVRGAATDETAPTLAAAAPSAVAESGPLPAPSSDALEETWATPVVPPPAARPARAAPSASRRRRPLGLATLLAVAALLVAGVVGAATLLPSATVTIVPRSEPVTATYEIAVAEPERRSGTVEASVTVVATETYETITPATGTVTFRNFNSTAIDVPAGTLVAAGDQAFETTEAVQVPSGSLTPSGTILAGEADAPVRASAPGPAANVDANAIDTVLSQGIAARLRAFPQNAARLVINGEPTTGGADARGPEITEADVERAVAALRDELERLADEARPDEDPDRIVIEPAPDETTIELPDDLAGTRDQAEVELIGSRSWTVLVVDTSEVEVEAVDRFEGDPPIPDGHELLESDLRVTLGDPRLVGDRVVVDATVAARTAPRIAEDEVIARSRGLTAEEARLALADLGDVSVEVWPGWVETVPELDWRIEVRIEAPDL
jgi:hypothetical protein